MDLFFICCWISLYFTHSYPTPNYWQAEFKEIPFTQFMHFSANTFVDTPNQQNCYKSECIPASNFNPTELDTDQWVQTAQAMGAGEICLTAHHVGGFCLWPSNHTTYSVASSPFKKDILRMFVNSCKKYGVKICYYLPPNSNGWFNGVLKYDTEKFIEGQMNLTKELLVNYGPVSRLWWDLYPDSCGGLAQCPGGFPEAFAKFEQMVRWVSPTTILGTGPDVQHSHGGESGDGSYPIWEYCNITDGLLRHCDGNKWGPYGTSFQPREADATIQNPGDRWFYRPNVPFWNASQIWAHYMLTVGRGDNFIFNLPPDTTGLIPQKYVDEVTKFGTALKATFNNPVYHGQGFMAMPCGQGTDIELLPFWEFNMVQLRELLTLDRQTITTYTYQISLDNNQHSWLPITKGVHGRTVGNRVIDLIPKQQVGSHGGTLRITATSCIGNMYKLWDVSLFLASPPP